MGRPIDFGPRPGRSTEQPDSLSGPTSRGLPRSRRIEIAIALGRQIRDFSDEIPVQTSPMGRLSDKENIRLVLTPHTHRQTRIYDALPHEMQRTRFHVKNDIKLLESEFNLGLFENSPFLPPDPDVAELLISELGTNATQHGTNDHFLIRTGVTPDGRFLVAVASDGEPIRPPQKVNADDEEGRGLYLVNELSHSWGIQRNVTINDEEKVWDNVVWIKFLTEQEQDEKAVERAMAAAYIKSLAREGIDPKDL